MNESPLPALPELLEVEVIPLSGCASVVLAVLSLGIIPWVVRSSLRRWPHRMSTTGIITRGGQSYAWADIRCLRHVVTIVNHVRTERWDLETRQGAVAAIVPHRLRDGARVLAFARRQVELAQQASSASACVSLARDAR